MRLSILLATALAVALVWAAPASAATVCDSGNVATFLAADVAAGCPGGADNPSETNALTVSVNPAGDIVFTDVNDVISDGDGPGGCSASGNSATCPGTLGFRFDLGAGDDRATVGAVANGGLTSTAGAGNDRLAGGPLGDLLDGGPGDDTVTGGDGRDELHGGDGADALDGGKGDDSLDGGPGPAGGNDNDAISGGRGEDSVWYLRSANGSVSLDNGGGDGQAGESDNV